MGLRVTPPPRRAIFFPPSLGCSSLPLAARLVPHLLCTPHPSAPPPPSLSQRVLCPICSVPPLPPPSLSQRVPCPICSAPPLPLAARPVPHLLCTPPGGGTEQMGHGTRCEREGGCRADGARDALREGGGGGAGGGGHWTGPQRHPGAHKGPLVAGHPPDMPLASGRECRSHWESALCALRPLRNARPTRDRNSVGTRCIQCMAR